MPITVKSIFRGEIIIANKSDLAVSENIDWFIEKYEQKYLEALLGVDFTVLFLAGLFPPVTDPVTPPDANMVALNNDNLKNAIASYIYYWYQVNEDTTTQGVGTVRSNLQNGTIVSATNKAVRAWNEMVCLSFKTLKFISDNQEDYPDFVFPQWYTALYGKWASVNFNQWFFFEPWYLAFYPCYNIPDIFIPINRFGV